MPEIQLFLRPNMDTAYNSLRNLEKSTTDIVLKYYSERLPLSVDPSEYGFAALESYELKANRFINEIKAMHDYMRNLKEQASRLSAQKMNENKMFADLAKFPVVLQNIEGVEDLP